MEMKRRWRTWTKKSRQRGGQETSRWPKLRLRTGPRLSLKLRPKREPCLPIFRVIKHNCARSYEWTIAALETGVKGRADVVCLQEPPRERWGIVISHSAYEMRKRERVWTAIQRGSGLTVDERTDLSRGATEDVIATDVSRRGERIMRIVNIDDQKNTHLGERPARKLNWQRVIRQRGTVLAGDFNAHSKRRDPRCQVQQNAGFWEDVIDENRLEIGNDGRPTHHWTRKDQEGESVIDLTLANRRIVKWTILADDHATGSDHELIEWEVGVDRQEEANHERVVGWNFAAMTEKDMDAAGKLWVELAKERAELDAECTVDEVEQEVIWCQEAMRSVLDATAKKIRICTRSR